MKQSINNWIPVIYTNYCPDDHDNMVWVKKGFTGCFSDDFM